MTLEEYIKQKYSPTTLQTYTNIIKRYLLVMGENAETASYTEVLNYIGLLRGQGLHPKSLKNNLFGLKIYYRYLVAIGKRTDHPCQFMNLKDQINRAIDVESLYPKEVLTEFYENWKSVSPESQRKDKIIIGLLIYQALLVLEITQLKVSDLDLEAGTIRIKGNVKNKGRILALQPNQILLFHSYLNEDYKKLAKGNDDYFLPSEEGGQLWIGHINRLINKGKEAHNKLIPLKIRQSVIAHLLKSNNDVRVVQEFAGHRNASSTEAYKQTGLEELKSAVERLHPLQ